MVVLDNIVSNGWFDPKTVTNETIKLIPYLFEESTLSLLDNYIQTLVKSYVRRKRNIEINIWGARFVPDKMPGLVFEDKVKFEYTTWSGWDNGV